LSVTASVAVRAPFAVGWNFIEIVQLAPAARLPPQVCVCGKSLAFPDTTMLLIVSTAVPVFFSVRVWEPLAEPTFVFGKLRPLGLSDTAGASPVPLAVTVWGDPVALSVTATVALRAPVAVGLNVTEIVQVAPAATLVPQLVVSGKSPLLPDMEILLIVSGAVPVLFRVTVWALLAEPTLVLGKLRVAGVSFAAATPVPVPPTGTV